MLISQHEEILAIDRL